MRRSSPFFAVVASILFAPAVASAELPQKSTLVISAERLTGIYAYSYKHDVPNPNGQGLTNENDSGTQINLLWGNGSLGIGGPPNIAAIPRIGVDYLVTDVLTLGGSAGLFTASGNATVNNVQASLPSTTAFVLAPRVGAAIHLGEQWTLWPRGGITYGNVKIEADNPLGNGLTETDRHTYSQLLLSLEVMIVYSPVPHFGFMLGPMFDLPLSGGDTYDHIEPARNNMAAVDTSVSYDAKLQNLGLTLGVLGYL